MIFIKQHIPEIFSAALIVWLGFAFVASLEMYEDAGNWQAIQKQRG